MTKLLVCFLFVIGMTDSVIGQKLDLPQSLEMAKENYPMIKAKRAASKAAWQEVSATRNRYIPRLILQHQFTFSTGNNVEGGFFPNEGTISPSGGIRPHSIGTGAFGSLTSAIMEWNVYNFGRLSENVKAATADALASQLDFENELFQHQVRVADAYLLLLVTHKLTEIQEKNVQRAESFSEAVDAGVRARLRAGVDSSLAHAEYARARVLLLESQRNEQTQRYRLAELLGRNALSFDLEIDSMRFYAHLPAERIVDSDLRQNPLLKVRQARIDAANQRAVAMKRNFYPTISFVAAGWARGAGVDNLDGKYHTDFSSGVRYQVGNYLFGVTAKWRISDGFEVGRRYEKLRLTTEQNRELYNQQEIELERRGRESEMQYEVMMEKARVVPIQLRAARHAYAQAQARYNNGLTDLPTLLQSLFALNQAEADLAIAYSNVWRSRLMIASAKGDLSIFFDSL